MSDHQGKTEKRKWYSRQTDAGTSNASLQEQQGIISTSPQSRKEGFLQRARSRSLFRGNDASASTESLNSNVSTDIPRTQPRAEDAPRPASQAALLRKDGADAVRVESERKVVDVGSDLTQSSTLTIPPGSTDTNVGADALPKRLSGWLLNMLGTDNPPSHGTARQVLDPNDATSKGALRSQSSNASIQRTSGNDNDHEKSTFALNSETRSHQKNVKGGMLAGLAASGRSKAEQAAMNSPTIFARSGFDRALRYFIDNHEADAEADEGIWLLGVWHGPKDNVNESEKGVDTSTRYMATDQNEGVSKGAESSVKGSDFGPDDDSSSVSIAAHKVKRSPSSITSAASTGSAYVKSGEGKSSESTTHDADAINIAQDQFSPQSSNMPRRLHPIRAQGNAGASKLLSAMAVGAEKTHGFQSDFSTRIWCSYRSHFSPISRDGSISAQAEIAAALQASVEHGGSSSEDAASISTQLDTLTLGSSSVQRSSYPLPNSTTDSSHSAAGGLGAAFGISSSAGGSGGLGEKMGIPNLWNRAAAAAQAYGLAGRSGLTTDAGWGCMLRTGQSVLANALLNVHLGRDWRRIAKPLPAHLAPSSEEAPSSFRNWRQEQEQFAKYTRTLSWFMDEPSQACPFGIHRMAREGKRLGKEVGEWFGPSTAAGAIRKLVDDYPSCGLSVNVASDGVVYLNQIRALANSKPRKGFEGSSRWTRPILILIGVRLGLEGVHPMYHDSIKATFSFPQSVGIAGGRPSSSYYFVGYQGNSLFYLDPHQVRPSVSFKHPPPPLIDSDEWWAQAYGEHDLATYHNDKPRRMPMKSLDPSMLLGFLIMDEESLLDFVDRVKELPRPIFSVQESMPKWMTGNDSVEGEDLDDERAIESISEGSFELGGDEHHSKDEDTGNMDTSEVNTVVGIAANSSEVRSPVNTNKANEARRSFEDSTPLSEATFELVDRQPTSSTKTAPLAPISFPSRRDDDDEEEDKEEEEVLVEHAGIESIKSNSQDEMAIEDDLSRQTSLHVAEQDTDGTWEDLQNDIRQSPRMTEKRIMSQSVQH
jgi:cysteine protease ATG4